MISGFSNPRNEGVFHIEMLPDGPRAFWPNTNPPLSLTENRNQPEIKRHEVFISNETSGSESA